MSATTDPDEFADAVKAIDVPDFVEDYIEQFRAICRCDPDRGGGHRERGKAADALRDAIRRAIYDAEQRTEANLTSRLDAATRRADEVGALLRDVRPWIDPWKKGYPWDLRDRIDAALRIDAAKEAPHA